MPRIAMPAVQAFKVEFTEYERGWGQKHWDTEYYDNEAEAKARAEAVTDYADPEDYYVGEVRRC